jgi:PIN domain nuclease of toxin-antitoxin system
VVADGANELVMSAASVWELAVKESIGELRIDEDLRGNALRNGFTELRVIGVHGAAVRTLPFHHRDPFDRLLVAQAQVEDLTLLTADRALSSYDVPIMMVDV